MHNAWLLAAMLLVAPDAQAYIDPGTGSILIQGLIAAVVGGLFYLRSAWGRIKAFFGRRGAEAADKNPKP
jgi:hypothetical protein